MKTIKFITSLLAFLFSPLCLSLVAVEVKPFDVFVELRARITQSDKSVTQINTIAGDVKIAIQNMDLNDDKLVGIDMWKLHHESFWAVENLTVRFGFEESKPSDVRDSVIECIAIYLEKVQSYIDPEWQWQNVSLKVVPPHGVPMAHPGMDPDAIENPEFRAEYLRRIEEAAQLSANNSKQSDFRKLRSSMLSLLHTLAKSPQYPHWTKESIETRFGTSPELLAAIREYWQQEEQ